MLRPAFPPLAATCAAAMLSVAAAGSAGLAAEGGAWSGDAHSAVRIVAGGARGDGTDRVYRAGIEMKIAPGWKTYWRYPGESGIPPRFDFSASRNVKAVHVDWPAPHRFTEAGSTSIGYKEGVVLPLRVEASDPKAPVLLHAKVDYAVCEKLCVPASASVEAPLNSVSPAGDAELARAEARVPTKSSVGQPGPLAVVAVAEEPGPSRRVLVDVRPSGPEVDLFAEGPDAAWSLPLPEKVPGAPPGAQRFSFEIDGMPQGAKLKGAALTLTAVSPDAAVETTFRLD